MARFEITQRITGQSWVERSFRVSLPDGAAWLAAREKVLFVMEQFGIQEEQDRDDDAKSVQSREDYDAILETATAADLVRSMIADTDDPPMIEPESGRWAKTFECYDGSWRTWEIRKL